MLHRYPSWQMPSVRTPSVLIPYAPNSDQNWKPSIMPRLLIKITIAVILLTTDVIVS
jgi:hypothetical protein